jgi:serine/threonine protein phosphatase PrpC
MGPDGTSYSVAKRGRGATENEDSWVKFELGGYHVLAVFDGHVNSSLSKFLAENIREILTFVANLTIDASSIEQFKLKFKLMDNAIITEFLSSLPNSDSSMELILKSALQLAEEIAVSLPNVDTATAGACASLAAVHSQSNTLYGAFCGDSTIAVLSEDYQILFRSSEHRVSNRPDEIERVIREGGNILRNKSIGMEWSNLSVTRALGDTVWKSGDLWKRDITSNKRGQKVLDSELVEFSRARGCVGVSSEPECFLFKFTTACYIAVGSDGFWDTFIPGNPFECPINPRDDATLVAIHVVPIT